LDKDVLHKSDVEELIGKRPYEEVKEVNLEATAEVVTEVTEPTTPANENNSENPL
jgi:hypothetical protein